MLQELPPKTEINLEVEISKDELVLYEAQRIKALETISNHDEEGAGQQHLRILAEIMKLRRLCCNPSLVLPDCGISSSKLKVFASTLEELLSNNHKALIFSQFVDHLKIIRGFLDEKGISYQYLDGSTPIKKRKERITRFQNGEGDVFLISLKAGGAGLNLTAADYAIHMDPWWNPAVEDQTFRIVLTESAKNARSRSIDWWLRTRLRSRLWPCIRKSESSADSLLEGTDSAGKVSAPRSCWACCRGRSKRRIGHEETQGLEVTVPLRVRPHHESTLAEIPRLLGGTGCAVQSVAQDRAHYS